MLAQTWKWGADPNTGKRSFPQAVRLWEHKQNGFPARTCPRFLAVEVAGSWAKLPIHLLKNGFGFYPTENLSNLYDNYLDRHRTPNAAL